MGANDTPGACHAGINSRLSPFSVLGRDGAMHKSKTMGPRPPFAADRSYRLDMASPESRT